MQAALDHGDHGASSVRLPCASTQHHQAHPYCWKKLKYLNPKPSEFPSRSDAWVKLKKWTGIIGIGVSWVISWRELLNACSLVSNIWKAVIQSSTVIGDLKAFLNLRATNSSSKGWKQKPLCSESSPFSSSRTCTCFPLQIWCQICQPLMEKLWNTCSSSGM